MGPQTQDGRLRVTLVEGVLTVLEREAQREALKWGTYRLVSHRHERH